MKRYSLALLALTMGSWVATQLFAYQMHYQQALGPPLATVGIYRLYPPTAGWSWAWRWAWQHPQAFRPAGFVLLAFMTLGAVPFVRTRKERPGAARWATRRDLRRQGLLTGHGMVLGMLGKTVLRHDGPEHCLIVAPTRSGKTTALVIPTLLEWHHSVIIHDPKTELYDVTAGYRQSLGRVIRLDPTSVTSQQYNPLDAIRLRTEDEMRDTQLVAAMLCDPDGEPTHGATAQHFQELAADWWIGLILHGLYTGTATTLASLDQYFSTGELGDILTEMQTTAHTKAGCHPAVRRAANAVARLADRELSGVLSTASRAMRLFLDPLVARMTARSDLTLHDLRERPRPMSLYVTFPYSDQERLRPLSRLIMRQVLQYCTQHQGGWRHRLLALVDEAQALNRMPALAASLNYAAGYGVKLCLITPSLNELDRLYGPHNNFVEGCHIRVAFAPNDDSVAGKFSRMTGMTEVAKERQSVARDSWRLLGQRSSTSTEVTTEPLLSPTALMQLGQEDILLLVGNAPPALVNKARYFNNATWLRRSRVPTQGGKP